MKHWVEYVNDWKAEPMAYWVHVEQDGKPWRKSEQYAPSAPIIVPGKGYPVICIAFDDVELRFSSLEQLKECIEVLSQRPLPPMRKLSALRSTEVGPNTHWLSRLPDKLKSPKTRMKLVNALDEVMRQVYPLNKSLARPRRADPRRRWGS
jgi:hypothetical protein